MITPLLTEGPTDTLRAEFGGDVRLLDFTPNVDDRGWLIELDFSRVPFPVRRVFSVAGVPAGTVRGGHRHRGGAQLLACVAGRVEVEVRRGNVAQAVALTPEAGALYVAGGVWSSQRYAEDDTVLVVLASEPFDPASYDTDYSE
jgi:dTDP-4-dehydrorhamnose 3,5-epimerase-like enzyme